MKATRLWLGFSPVVCALAAALPAAELPSRPNIVIVVSDNQGYRDLGCYGSPEVKSPNLDRLAAGGLKATKFYVASGECTPSRASILTGRYPQRCGLYDMIRNQEVNFGHRFTMPEYNVSPEMTLGLDLREITFGNVAQSAGYATAAIGKWDSGRARRYLPQQRGFDFYYGFAVTGVDYWTGERYGVPSLFRGNELEKPNGFTEELFTEEALKFIRRSRDRPFLLYLAYQAPSGNKNLDERRIRPPKKYLDLYPGRDPADRRTEYMAVISCMDDGVGRIVRELEQLGLDRQTLVIFFSDNAAGTGAADAVPFKARNTQLDQLGEGGVRPCFIASWPGVIPAGTVSDEFMSAFDLFPTIAALSGATIPAGLTLDGFNLMPTLQGKAPSSRKEMFWQSQNGRAARVGDFKWLDTPKAKGLFDLTKDPGEDHDLSSQHPEILTRVQARWETWRREMDAAEPRGPFRDY